jgi:hypothetical protein
MVMQYEADLYSIVCPMVRPVSIIYGSPYSQQLSIDLSGAHLTEIAKDNPQGSVSAAAPPF